MTWWGGGDTQGLELCTQDLECTQGLELCTHGLKWMPGTQLLFNYRNSNYFSYSWSSWWTRWTNPILYRRGFVLFTPRINLTVWEGIDRLRWVEFSVSHQVICLLNKMDFNTVKKNFNTESLYKSWIACLWSLKNN